MGKPNLALVPDPDRIPDRQPSGMGRIGPDLRLCIASPKPLWCLINALKIPMGMGNVGKTQRDSVLTCSSASPGDRARLPRGSWARLSFWNCLAFGEVEGKPMSNNGAGAPKSVVPFAPKLDAKSDE